MIFLPLPPSSGGKHILDQKVNGGGERHKAKGARQKAKGKRQKARDGCLIISSATAGSSLIPHPSVRLDPRRLYDPAVLRQLLLEVSGVILGRATDGFHPKPG